MTKNTFVCGELLEVKRTWQPEGYLYKEPKAEESYEKGDLVLILSQSDNKFTIINTRNSSKDKMYDSTLRWLTRSIVKPIEAEYEQ